MKPMPPPTPAAAPLTPEQPIALSPLLAQQLGVEEAVLFSVLQNAAKYLTHQEQNGYQWLTLTQDQLQRFAPFWQERDIQRLTTNLREAGVILQASAPYTQCRLLKFAFKTPETPNTQGATRQAAPNYAQQAGGHTAGKPRNIIAPHWQPERDTLNSLAQLGIPEAFSLQQVDEFVAYWRERNEPAHSWNSKFRAQVIHQWRDYQNQQNQRPQTTLMHKGWRPSEDALEVLSVHAGISRDFIEDAIPEFVLYWREQGASCDNWNRRFRDHVNRQWARYNAALEHDPTPRRIPEGWQPSNDVFDVLRLANIDINFAQQLVPEFVIYWRDSNQIHASWNTKFLQFAKRRWANKAVDAAHLSRSTRDISLEELVTDRSWAD